MDLSLRQQNLLRALIDEYIKTAEPVSSKSLVNSNKLDVSTATVRNEFAALEREGYIRQPHTSAGRVPTEKGYMYYLSCFQKNEKRKRHDHDAGFKQAVISADTCENAVKGIAKKLVDLTGEMALVSFDPSWNYFTGMSNLFRKPDFQNLQMAGELTNLLDKIDDVINEMFDELNEDPQVFVGSKNPFGENMSSIMVKYRLPDETIALIGLVGPLRMNYKKNIALLEDAIESLDEYDKDSRKNKE
ncbi:MAG: Transcriptional regulator of heat shock protein [uncultured bacterium]|nr:MAG: Transcriptional regulator of heat shock protein [uncultured bacterium]HBD05247.1 hypothetical protein [Candidatus Uhrbacteria bacterium]